MGNICWGEKIPCKFKKKAKGKTTIEEKSWKPSAVIRQPRTIAMTTVPGKLKARDQEDELEDVINKDHLADVGYVVKYSRWVSKLLGLYPYVITNTTRLEKVVWNLAMPLPTVFILSWLAALLAHITTRDLSTPEMVGCLGPIVIHSSILMKNHILILHRNLLKLCMQHVETDWRRIENEEDREIMRRNVKLGHRISFICVVSMYGGGFLFNSMALFSGSYLNEFNQTVRPLSLPGFDIFVDLTVGYNYEIVFCANWASVFYINTIIIAICDLTAVLAGHTSGQIQIIISRLEALVDPPQDTLVINSRLAFIVKSHVRTIGFATKIDQLLQEICLIEAVCSTLQITWFAYSVVKNLEDNSAFDLFAYLFLLVSFCFNIFIFCHVGENLKEQFEEVGRAAYMLEWYRLPDKTALALIMLIVISKNPPKLTAGQMIEMSYNSFGNIMRTSFAYLNMLHQMGD